MRKLLTFLAVLVMGLIGTSHDSRASTTVAVDTGWVSGIVDNTSDLEQFDFTLTADAIFSLVDCCVAGDDYIAFVGIAYSVNTLFDLPLLPIPLAFGNTDLDAYWLDGNYSRLQISLTPGDYVIGVMGSCGGSCPAGFGVRLDTVGMPTVPVPAAGLLLASAMGGVAALRRRKRG